MHVFTLYVLIFLTGFVSDFCSGMWTKAVTELRPVPSVWWTIVHGLMKVVLIYEIAVTKDFWFGVFFILGLALGTYAMVVVKKWEIENESKWHRLAHKWVVKTCRTFHKTFK